jgi:hypothetical protein
MNHSFDIAHATLYGMAEAVLISNFQFWISKNKANGKHLHAGRTWTYNSVRAFADLFPYLSIKQVRRALDQLVTDGVLLKGNFNDSQIDQTLWYAFSDESQFLVSIPDLPKRANGVAQEGEPFAQTGKSTNKTDVNTDRKPDSRAHGTRLPTEWFLTKAWAEEAMHLQPTWTADHIRFEADKFRDHWTALSGQKGLKTDWLATWRNWCRNAGPMKAEGKDGSAAWWLSPETMLAKALEVGVGHPVPGENGKVWEARIRAAIQNGGKPPVATRPLQASTVRDPGTEIGKTIMSEENRAAMLAAARNLGKRSVNPQSQ